MITPSSKVWFAAAALITLAVPSAEANCIMCDELIDIDESRANCLIDNFEAISSAIGNMPNGRKSIDLDACSIDGEQLSARGGLETLPDLGSALAETDGTTKSAYLLDLNYLACLRQLVDEEPRPIDPEKTFDLYLLCQS